MPRFNQLLHRLYPWKELYLVFGITLVLLPLFGCQSFRYEHDGITLGKQHYPGVLVDVGGYDLYFNCTAPATYTVLLEAGGGMPSLMWKPVQDLLAAEEDLQVCSYDRAGHGWSDPYPGPYSIEQEVEALHTALQKLDISERLVLVGASYGGFHARLYAARYPEPVIGLIYGDANSVYFFDKHPDIVEALEASTIPRYMKVVPRGLMRRVLTKRFRDEIETLNKEDARALAHLVTSKKHIRADLRKNQAFGTTVATMRSIENSRTIKTVVITRGQRYAQDPWTTQAREQDWRDGQKTFLEGVEDGLLVIAHESGHAVNFDQPDLIAEVVVNVVNADRNQQHPAGPSR